MTPPRALRAFATLVPRSRREVWLREWTAEWAHRRTDRAGSSEPGPSSGALIFTLHAAEDAVGMWSRNRGTSTFVQELRVAVRSLARAPGFALVAILTLGLGIGANTAIFSVVRSVVLRTLPFDAPDQLVDVRLSFRNLETGRERAIVASEPEFLEVRAENVALAELAGYWRSSANFGGDAEPERIPVASVSANFLTTLGVEAALGRGFGPDEDLPGRERVTVLSHGLWRRAYGGDPSVIGRDAVINGGPARIIGVLPADFLFPGNPVDALLPNVIDPAELGGRSSHYINMLGRLAPGFDRAAAQARTDALAQQRSEAFPDRHQVSPTHPITLVPIRESMIGGADRMLFLLQGAVALVLLIGCANIASLLLVRAEERQQETGVRVALGGSRRNVVTPFLAESLVLALVGAVLAIGLTIASVDLVEQLGPDVLRRVGGVRVDAPVLIFAIAASVGSVLLFGLGPALAATAGDPTRHLRQGGRYGTAGRGQLIARRAIVTGQVALSVVLIVASGVLLRSFARLQSVDPGFQADGVVTVEFSLSSGAYPEPAQVAAFHRALADRLAALPGIVNAGSIRSLPFADGVGIETLSPTDEPVDMENLWNAQYQVVGPGYLQALQVPLLEGRYLTRSDDDVGAPAVAVVDQAMAELYWPDESPLGRTFKHGVRETPTPELRVVGVVGNVRVGGYAADLRPTFYVPRAHALSVYGGLGTRSTSLVVRSAIPPAAALQAVRSTLRELDPGLPVTRMASMDTVMGQSVTSERFLMFLVGTFSLLALVLGAVGIAGVVAYTVARRTRELGLRMALGADRGRVLRGVLGGVVSVLVVGTGLGLLGAVLSGSLLADHLYETSPTDPGALLLGPAVLLTVSLAAAYLPALKATRVSPTVAMRSE